MVESCTGTQLFDRLCDGRTLFEPFVTDIKLSSVTTGVVTATGSEAIDINTAGPKGLLRPVNTRLRTQLAGKMGQVKRPVMRSIRPLGQPDRVDTRQVFRLFA
jgi:hypothetical protein